MRLIDADALSEKLCETTIFIKDGEVFQRMINDAPTVSAEAVQVVRCKDCKSSRVYGKTTQWLACEDVMEGQATDPNGYCYLGERKEP